MSEQSRSVSVKACLHCDGGATVRELYAISELNGGKAAFRFALPNALPACEVRVRTDFAVEISHPRVFAGERELDLRQSLSSDALETVVALRGAPEGILRLECDVACLSEGESLRRLRAKYDDLKDELDNLTAELENDKKHIELLLLSDRELREIRGMFFWKVIRFFRSIRDALLPPNSRRRLLATLLRAFLRHPITFLKKISGNRVKRFMDGLQMGTVADTANRLSDCMRGNDVPPEPVKLAYPAKGKPNARAEDYEKFSMPFSARPEVTIVIPAYNQFHFTYACLRSVAQNSGDIPYEVIVADDCSADLTKALADIVSGVRVIANERNLRFLRNCNNAAAYAKGRYILFLNNDTQVQENWLKPLIDLMETSDRVGMVGSKLIYPDGRLQEAGGILWRDGSAWHYGYLQDPSMPEFNYVKEADYISGASLMIRAELWRELGGFDERFAPAYCEDSDLAMRVRAAGYEALYQPKSVVAHFEGVSNGTDTAQGQKTYQVVNQRKLFEKWKDVLEREHNPNAVKPFLARDRSIRKKTLLMVDHYVPMFDKDAGSRTVFQYLKLFVSQGYNVKFIGDSFFPHEPYASVLQQMGIEVLYGNWYAQHWKDWLKDNGADIQYVFLNRPHVAVNYIDAVRQYTSARVVYYGHDLHYLRTRREYELTGKKEMLRESEDWQKKEFALMRKSDMNYYPSEVEVEAIRALDPSVAVKAIPAYLFDDVADVDYRAEKREDILFVGGYNHGPNVDAAVWMAKEIMPALVQKMPGVRLRLIGSNAPKEVMLLANEHIAYEGMVSDEKLDELYAACRVSVVPLRYGAGIKGKVVEAMKHGLPVMTTSVGAEGIIGAESILCVADSAKDFAERLAEMYADGEGLRKRSAASVQYVREHYSPRNAVAVVGVDFDMESEHAGRRKAL